MRIDSFFSSPSHPQRNGINGGLILVHFRPQSTENGHADIKEQVPGQGGKWRVKGHIRAKKKPRKSAAKGSNREASNRVDRSHSENPDDWITLIKIQPNPLPIG
jgi:hypothetical protein